jgi:hypothetical protein
MPLFCRHNRLTANCPICSRELDAELKGKAPPRAPSTRTRSQGARSGGSSTTRRSSSVVTRRAPRAADDGYRNPLVPGLRATADAERLAAALAAAHARIEPPGPYPALAAEPDLEEATWLAFLLALVGPGAPELQHALLDGRPEWASGELPDLPDTRTATIAAYRSWARRSGSQAAAFTGEPAWSPGRRFGRVFERLALPGFDRPARYELLVALGAAGLYPLEAEALHLVAEDDATSLAAKRLLVSADLLLLERRARELAQACGVPIAAFDRGLAVWGDSDAEVDADATVPDSVRGALGLQ